MIIVTVVSCLAAMELYEQKNLEKKLHVLNTAFAVDEIISQKFTQKFKAVEIENFVQRSNRGNAYLYNLVIFDDIDNEERVKRLPPEEKNLYDLIARVVKEKSSLANSYYSDSQQFFANPGKNCNVFIFKGTFDKSTAFFDVHKGNVFSGRKSDGYLINFAPSCFKSPREEKTALLIKVTCPKWIACRERWLIGFARKDMDLIFPTKIMGDDLINNIEFNKNDFLKSYSSDVLKLIEAEDQYFYQPIEQYQRIAFTLASYKKTNYIKAASSTLHCRIFLIWASKKQISLELEQTCLH